MSVKEPVVALQMQYFNICLGRLAKAM